MRIKANNKICLTVCLGIFAFLISFASFPKDVSAQLADSPWPVFGHDARHTNVSPYEIGKDKKDLLWSYKTGAGIESSPVIGRDGTIYVGSHDGYFYAFNPDGSIKWKVKLTEPSYDERWNISKAIMASPVIAKDGTIYINSASNFLHALNPDGKEKWRFPIKWHNDFWNGPNLGPDGTIYIGTAREGSGSELRTGIYAISPEGKELWFYREASGVTVIPTVGEKTIYAGAAETTTNKGRIIALDKNGQKKWQFDLEEWLEGSAALGDDGTIFTGSKEGYIYAINPDGTEKWRFKTGGGINAIPTVGNDETIYVGSWDGNFYALDQTTGKEKWRFDVKIGRDPKLFEGYPGKETICTNAALSKDGVLIFADVFDTVYGVDTNGKQVWRWKNINGSGIVSSPAIGKDGTIYFGDEGGYFYALSSNKAAKPKITTPSIMTIIKTWIKKFYNSSKPIFKKQVETEQYEDKFTKNSKRVPGPIEIRVREFGETGRSCAGKGCGALKDTCVRWNKTKDNCYEMIKTSPASSDRYKIYCNMVVVNQDNEKSADVSLDLNYTTADGVKHLAKSESFLLTKGSGQSLLWTYDVESNNIGRCGYSNINIKEKE